MSASRTAARLIRSYPPAWRARYGPELEDLIVELASGRRRVPWRLRADVVAAGLRERARGLGRGAGAGGGLALVVWGFAVFGLSCGAAAKSTEHWRDGAPGLRTEALAKAASEGAVAGACLVGGALLIALALAAPRLLTLAARRRWPRALLRRLALAGCLSILLLPATLALVAWADRLTPAARDGHDIAYSAGFLAWAALGTACLLAWAAAAAAAARALELSDREVRVARWIAGSVAVLMALTTAAGAIWWAGVAAARPGPAPAGDALSSMLPGAAVAGAVMLLATALTALGARRLLRSP